MMDDWGILKVRLQTKWWQIYTLIIKIYGEPRRNLTNTAPKNSQKTDFFVIDGLLLTNKHLGVKTVFEKFNEVLRIHPEIYNPQKEKATNHQPFFN